MSSQKTADAGRASRSEVMEILNQLEKHSPNWIKTVRRAFTAREAALMQIADMPCTMVNDSESLRHTIKTMQATARAALCIAALKTRLQSGGGNG